MCIVHKEVCVGKHWKKWKQGKGRNTCQLCDCVIVRVCCIDTKTYCLFVLENSMCRKNHIFWKERWFMVLYYKILQRQWKTSSHFIYMTQGLRLNTVAQVNAYKHPSLVSQGWYVSRSFFISFIRSTPSFTSNKV